MRGCLRRGRCVLAALLLSVPMPVTAAELRVNCLGEGPPVFLIGGGPAFTTWNLGPIQERLSERYRVCRWDQRGVGENAGVPVTARRSALSQWLQDMAAVLPPEPVTLWGHSWGALQVQLFARRYPARVRRIVLSNPVDPALLSLAGIERKRHVHAGLGAGLSLDDIGTPAEDLHNLRLKVASYFVDADKGWAYAQGFTRADANNALNVRIWEEYRARPLSDADVRDMAGLIAGIIYCRDDVLQPEALAEYRRLLPAGRHEVLTGCAHFPWEENPQDYHAALLRLLDGR